METTADVKPSTKILPIKLLQEFLKVDGLIMKFTKWCVYYLPSYDIKKDVWCDFYTQGGRWTVFQQRRDGSVDFDRSWSHYENGFGDPNTEYWIGNEALYHLTLSGGNELLILMQTWDGVWKYAHYTDFYIGHKNDNYRLHLSEYSGTAGKSRSAVNSTWFNCHVRRRINNTDGGDN
ncbi:unnamed protein product [Mytilus edulis]|uniref:Fibrinogen C-terminal domain-containing protein n=1 Tax=Mytilus edulis TaxID=6550 RepID=A0A8S3TL27_MYTED|nr:unnamed protein product [Mytilus edulis]